MDASAWGWYPDDFCREMGRYVFAFAELENAAGELILLGKTSESVTSSGWSRSGAQLMAALRTAVPGSLNFSEMCDDIERLTVTRNLFLHGEWLFETDTSAKVMKRIHDKSKNIPGYQLASEVTPDRIGRESQRVMAVERALQLFIADKMVFLS